MNPERAHDARTAQANVQSVLQAHAARVESLTRYFLCTRTGMGKLRPAGHIRPVGIFNMACQILIQNRPNHRKDCIHFAFFPALQLLSIDGALQTHMAFGGVWSFSVTIATALSYFRNNDWTKEKKRRHKVQSVYKEWTARQFFPEIRSKAVYSICQEIVVVFKEYDMSHHFSTKHANNTSNHSMQGWAEYFSPTNYYSRVKRQGKLFAGIQISKSQ